MKEDIQLKDLLLGMDQAIREKAVAEKTAEKAEIRRRKWHNQLLHLKDLLAHKEYRIN